MNKGVENKNRIVLGASRGISSTWNELGYQITFSAEKRNTNYGFSFESLIREQHPEVIEQIVRSDPSFSTLAEPAQRARIYASPHLPEWVKAMRDSWMAYNQVESSSVGPINLLQRSSDIVPSYEVRDEQQNGEEVTKVIFSLNNVRASPVVEGQETMPRFLQQYQGIRSRPLRDCIKTYSEHNSVEKDLLLNKPARSYIAMSDEEFREVGRLLIKSDLQLVELLEYFTKHPEKFRDSDFQTLFQPVFFDNGRLESLLKVPGLGDRLVRLLEKNYEQFHEEDDLPTERSSS